MGQVVLGHPRQAMSWPSSLQSWARLVLSNVYVAFGVRGKHKALGAAETGTFATRLILRFSKVSVLRPSTFRKGEKSPSRQYHFGGERVRGLSLMVLRAFESGQLTS